MVSQTNSSCASHANGGPSIEKPLRKIPSCLLGRMHHQLDGASKQANHEDRHQQRDYDPEHNARQSAPPFGHRLAHDRGPLTGQALPTRRGRLIGRLLSLFGGKSCVSTLDERWTLPKPSLSLLAWIISGVNVVDACRPVCTENLMRMIASPNRLNVSGDDRATLLFSDPAHLAVQVKEPT